MLSGSRMINAIELQKIAEFLNVSMESLVKVPQVIQETNTVKAFMGMVESQEVKEGLAIADEIAIPYRAAVLRLFEEDMQVLDDIYDGKFQLLKNGDLQYLK